MKHDDTLEEPSPSNADLATFMMNTIETLHPTAINSQLPTGWSAVIVEDVEEGAAEVPRSQGCLRA